MSSTPDSILNKPAVSFSQHIKATAFLGLPLVGSQITQMLVGVTDTIMLGWLGTAELAAGTLAFQTFFIFLIFGIGYGAAMIPLIASALGREEPQDVRRATRMGIWSLIGLAVLFMIPLWFTADILRFLGQSDELADLAQRYMRIAQWTLIPAFILIGLRSFLTSIEKASAVFWISVFIAFINAPLNYIFIFGKLGVSPWGIEGAGIATLLANTIGATALVGYVIIAKEAKPYTLFVRFWRADWAALREINMLGLPISLTILAEAGLFAAASLMVGWIGTVELAAHGIALQIASLAFMLPLGISQASSVRVGNALGRGDQRAIGLAGYSAMTLATGLCLISALFCFAFPELLVSPFLDADNPDIDAIFKTAIPLIWVGACFQLVDGIQVISGGNLRGLKDTQIPLLIALVSYWPIGVGTAYLYAFVFGFGAVGVWMGLATGLAVAGVALTHRFVAREAKGLI